MSLDFVFLGCWQGNVWYFAAPLLTKNKDLILLKMTSRSCLIRFSVVSNDQVQHETLYEALLEATRELDQKQLHLDYESICILPYRAYMYGIEANRDEEPNTAVWVIGWRGTGRKEKILLNELPSGSPIL